jgi:hypothetical protein
MPFDFGPNAMFVAALCSTQNKPSAISSVSGACLSLSLSIPFLPYPPPPLRATHRRHHPNSTPATHSPPPTDSHCLRQDLAAGVEDLRPVLALAVRLAAPSPTYHLGSWCPSYGSLTSSMHQPWATAQGGGAAVDGPGGPPPRHQDVGLTAS